MDKLDKKPDLALDGEEFDVVADDPKKRFGTKAIKEVINSIAARENDEIIEREKATQLLKILIKNSKANIYAKTWKDLLGVTGDQDLNDKTVEAAEKILKKAGINIGEIAKKLAENKTENGESEIIKNGFILFIESTSKNLNSLGTTDELVEKLAQPLKNVSPIGMKEFFFFWENAHKAPKVITEKMLQILKKGEANAEEMAKDLLVLKLGKLGVSIASMANDIKEVSKEGAQSAIDITEEMIKEGLINPVVFAQKMTDKCIKLSHKPFELIQKTFPDDAKEIFAMAGIPMPAGKKNEIMENAYKYAGELGKATAELVGEKYKNLKY